MLCDSTLLILGVYLVFHFVTVGRLALTAESDRVWPTCLSYWDCFCALSTLFWLLGGGNTIGVIICHILGSLVSIFVTRHLLRRNFSVLSFRIPSKKDADLFKRLGESYLVLAFYYMVRLYWHCYRMPFWSAIWEVQKLSLNSIFVYKIAEALVLLIWRVPESLAPYFVQMDRSW